MAKFYGIVGYGETKEIRPGVWSEDITERYYYGDVLTFNSRWESGGQVNDDLNINNKISIVADPFACQNFHMIRYIEWIGTKWKVTNAELSYPRLILTMGGVYNGQPDGTA